MKIPHASWAAASERRLLRAIAALRARIPSLPPGAPPDQDPRDTSPNALDQLVEVLALSPAERDLLVLCVGAVLDPEFARLCPPHELTFARARAWIPALPWGALSPDAPLRAWRLLEPDTRDAPLPLAPLVLDEFVWMFLLGERALDPRLRRAVEAVDAPAATALLPAHEALANEVVEACEAVARAGEVPVVILDGPADAARAVATVAGWALCSEVCAMSAAKVPAAPDARDLLLRLWERYAVLTGAALRLDDVDPRDAAHEGALAWVTRARHPLLACAHGRLPQRVRPRALRFTVPPPTPEEQRVFWRSSLVAEALPEDFFDAVASHFELLPEDVEAVVAQARVTAADAPLSERLWSTALLHAGARMEGLAQPVVPTATWADLAVPAHTGEALRELLTHVRLRYQVQGAWGMARGSARGQGVAALFAGPSGTGKTTAAEVLARALRLNLFRVDLSATVSKYIGETEKNLRRIFDAAEAGGCVLLFDEADALFGKRSEVKDSHDRYANLEVSYLLQRVECFRGVAILTTNLKQAIDPAFLRRLRFVVDFPFPDAAQRAALWRAAFPAGVPTADIDPDGLARLAVSGGLIRNIALHAAFLAADAGDAVRPRHVLHAARRECARHDRSVSDAEARWILGEPG